ncbi:MAG: hypothetical protein VB084_14785 [Syntrophomonadaceae bacterium]|nr:hypothetical protein [Syntrophomonadaceae bacterium]
MNNYLIIAAAVLGLILLAIWHAKNYAYICKSCSHKFSLSAVQDFYSPQGLTAKYAKCPNCHQWTWAEVVDK